MSDINIASGRAGGGAMRTDDPAVVWRKLGEFIEHRIGDAGVVKVDLHQSSHAVRGRVAYCSDHGEVDAFDYRGRWQCWCGDTVMLKTEVDAGADERAALSMANDPMWRC